jgi:DNA polymerase
MSYAAGTRLPTVLGHSTVLPSMDFETYSEAGYRFEPGGKVRGNGGQGKGGLPVVGTPQYAAHPSTEILCLYYDLKDGRGERGWIPGMPDPQDLLDHIANGGPIAAWNITFEFWIWREVAVRRLGWPALSLAQCYCDMAKSRRHSLPGSLASAATVLGTADKDKGGKNLIQKLTRPHTPTKNRPAHRRTPATHWEDFAALYAYCGQDVTAEDAAAALTPDLTPYERQTWLLDQTINLRGVQVDITTLDCMLDILGQTERRYTLELAQITGGAVGSVSEVAKFGAWLGEQGVTMPDMTKDSVAQALLDPFMPDDARRALEIRQTLGAANVKKLRTLKLQVSDDGRLRDQYRYCGADRTGRWAAGGVQLQNITAKGPKTLRCESCELIYGHDATPAAGDCPRCGAWMSHVLPDWTIEGVEQAIADIQHRDLDLILRNWGDPIAVLCGCLRGLFTACEGHELVCVDFSAIEAVAAACLSRCQWRIDVFSTPGACIYTQSASQITGTPMHVYEDYKREHGNHHPDRKRLGKVAELASGYGGWINAWKAFGADMDDSDIKASVLKWRADSPEIVDMWGGQFRWCGPGKWDFMPEMHGLEGAAVQAIMNPGQCFSHTDITYGVKDDVLLCRLPSGRYLHYHRPRLTPTADKLNRGPAVAVTFEGHNSNSAKGPVGWHRMETFGGRLFENVVQAVALDIQAEALHRAESNGYPIVMHTHDEGVAEVPTGSGSVEQLAAIMSERPTWAAWWPLKAAGWKHKRYQKD